MRKRGKWPFSRPVLVCLLGLLLGIGFSFLIRSLKNAHRHANLPKCFLTEAQIRPKEPQLLLVGVMTAAKYVDTRAYNVWKTWAKSIPGKVLFFVSENTVSQHKDMPLIRLKGVNDDYPPQKKSFAMLRWFFDNQLENFHWFLRADDDLYVRGEKLDQFLRSLDPNKAHLIGQAGLGNTAEYGQLSLGPQDNYCMGGPGVVLSREALRSVAGHLESCLANLLTTHEDVEVGRCLRKHVGIACTWNYEMQTLFHNNQTVPNVYDNGNLEELRHAITLHPIKKPEVMKKIHVHALSLRLNELRAKRMTLQRDLKRATQHSLNRRFTNTTTDVQNWDYMAGHISFCANQVNCPRHTTDVNMMAAVNEIIVQLFDDFNANARQRGRILQFQNIQYSYARVEPRHGVDYVLDMILWFKKFRPPHRATLSVRRHAYVQQTFGPIETITDRKFRQKLSKRNHIAEDDGLSSTDSTIYLIVPLKGRPNTFQRFSDNLLSVIPPQEKKVEIVLVFYKSENETDDNIIKNSISELSHILPVHVIDMTNKSFNRGQALTAGTAILPTNALLFFIDVDMIFKYDTLERIRLNTIMGVQAYFPIVFSEFSRHSWSSLDRDEQRHFSYNRRRGYFRHFGFGIASIYKQDFDAVGGFGNFEGWGLEDVDLFEKCISSHLRVLRAPDQLVHVYHSIKCPSTMPTKQRNMCIGSKTASLASLDSLAEQISLYT